MKPSKIKVDKHIMSYVYKIKDNRLLTIYGYGVLALLGDYFNELVIKSNDIEEVSSLTFKGIDFEIIVDFKENTLLISSPNEVVNKRVFEKLENFGLL